MNRNCVQSNIFFLITGMILLLGEIYKQLFYYYALCGGHYFWWIFPFQLCSLPMYFCLAMPLIHSIKIRKILCTFMVDFGLLGAIATFVDPAGIMGTHWSLTLHGFLWHILLIIIALYIITSRLWDPSSKGFFRIIPLFAIVCAIAELINCLCHEMGEIDMFYISPYGTSTQLIFSDVEDLLGRPLEICIYILCMLLGAFIIHKLAGLYDTHQTHDEDACGHGKDRT